MNRNPGDRQKNGVPTGFTLVEVILALSLASILLAGVYGAIDQSYKLTASGREEMQRAQLARALIRKMELDIRSITFTPPPPEEDATTTSTTTTSSSTTSTSQSSSSGGSGSGSGSGTGSGGGGGGGGSGARSSGGGSGGGGGGGGGTSTPNGQSNNSTSGTSGSSSSSSSTSSTDSSEAEPLPPNSRSLGVRGTAMQMEMSIARPRRDLLPGTGAAAGAPGSSDLRGVTYSFATSSSMGTGLIRAEGERMAIEQVEANGGNATQVSQIQMLAPEVIAVNFRYFDGHIWQTAWDSETNARLPRAIEISIKLRPPQQKSGFFAVAASRSMETFRTVVLIPISDPYPPEFLE